MDRVRLVSAGPGHWPVRPSSGTTPQVYTHIASRSLWAVSFWAGQRPPATPLLIKLVGSSSGFLAAQAVIAALAWGFLAWTVGRLVTPGWRQVVAAWSILAFATAFPVTLWNRSVLSESLSMSLLALVVRHPHLDRRVG